MVSALPCSIVHIHVLKLRRVEIAPDRISLFFFLIIVYLDSEILDIRVRKRIGFAFGIIDRDLNFQVAVIDAPESLGHFGEQ